MFIDLALHGYGFAVRVGAHVDGGPFDAPDPDCEGGVEEGINGHGDGGVGFCGFEAEGVVPVEGCCAEGEC